MEEDEYDVIVKKPIKLESDKDRRKKKIKNRAAQDLVRVSDESKVIIKTATKAEEAFKQKQQKMAEQRILQKASKTHKQRVEEFNKHLDSLSEHYDIPKVSWTK